MTVVSDGCRDLGAVGDASGSGWIGDPRKDGELWTFALVEERLVGAVDLWRRSPGAGASPFAGDGPWGWLTERTRAEAGGGYVGRGPVEPGPLRRLPLGRGEVAERDAASALLLLVGERDRRLVAVVIAAKARRGETKRVRWSEVRRVLIAGGESGPSARGLGMRYARALAGVAAALNCRKDRAKPALAALAGAGPASGREESTGKWPVQTGSSFLGGAVCVREK